MSDALLRLAARRVDADCRQAAVADEVAAETPVALLYNGVAHAVMMATPQDLADFAIGFSLTEGIVATAGECELIEQRDGGSGIELHLAIPSARFQALEGRGRSTTGRSGCGLCGTEALAAAIRPLATLPACARPTPDAIRAGLAALAAGQGLNARCGGLHAAAFVAGDSVVVREDVGRHNAIDKVVGAIARAGGEVGDGFLAVTSRASYEVVHKAASVGIGCVAAISAPTALAVALARSANLHLIAFARDAAMTVYAD